MKNLIGLIFVFLLSFVYIPYSITTSAYEENKRCMIAIVIDDFGSEDRTGIDGIFDLNIPLTCAIMPGMKNTVADAERAHELGHEVILHMPMEASVKLPDSWYGPKVIRNYFSEAETIKLLDECINEIPHVVGMNIHMGTGISRNKKLLTAMMKHLKKKNLYFLDSKTVEDSMCPASASDASINLLSRDVFIENHNNHTLSFTTQSMEKAKNIAKEQGYAIVIGHVGPEGGTNTISAIKNSIESFKNDGIEFVKLSEIYNLTKKSV